MKSGRLENHPRQRTGLRERLFRFTQASLWLACLVFFLLALYFQYGVALRVTESHQRASFRITEERISLKLQNAAERVISLMNTVQILGGGETVPLLDSQWIPMSLKEVFIREPFVSGITVIDEAGQTWGLGKFKKDRWIRVTPINENASPNYEGGPFTAIRVELDDQGRILTGSEQVIPEPRLASPWYQIVSDCDDRIRWTAPFTSSVIGEPVMSAVIKVNEPRRKAFAVHIRLSDLSSITQQTQFMRTGTAALVDKQGRLISMPALLGAIGTEDSPADVLHSENTVLLKPISSVALGPANGLFKAWLKAGKPLQTPLEFSSMDNAKYLGSVSRLELGDTELFLLMAAPQEEFAQESIEVYGLWLAGAGMCLLFLALTSGSLSLRWI